MKRLNSNLLSSTCVLLAAVTLPAQAAYINDNPDVGVNDFYMGADDHSYGDNIELAATDDYGIEGMTVTRVGNTLTISIDTEFAGKGDNNLFSGSTTGGTGIGYGDLFMSGSWAPSGIAPYQFDDNSNGTQWLYGFSLDNRWQGIGAGTGMLYSLNGASNNANTLLSDDFMTSAIGTYRDGQEVAVDTASSDTTSVGGNSSSWSVNNSTVNFTIDLTGTTLAGNNENFAFHWAMTCANDTIEGEVTGLAAIPLPASVWLMGSGLLGLVSIARRRRKQA